MGIISRHCQRYRVHVADYRLLFGTPAQKRASVGRNPEGEDPQGLRAEREHAVPSETSADAQTHFRDESGNATSGNPLPVKK